MDLAKILPSKRVAAMTEAGYWSDKLITDYLDAAAVSRPDRPAIVDHRHQVGGITTLTYAELNERVTRIALGLVDAGVEPGDVVSFQLPNWWEFSALHYACVRIGAITNPLMPIFRRRELGFMLKLAESRVLVVPNSFRGFDYPAMADELEPELPALKRVFVVGGGGDRDFARALVDRAWEAESDAEAVFAARRPSANDVTQIMYTSGTTGEPKGVMHTANTLFANVLPFAERLGLTTDDAIFCPTPIAHQLGYLYGVLMPVILGAKVVMQDTWDAGVAARLVEDEGGTFAMGATPFLADFADFEGMKDHDLGTLSMFVSAGAPIPRALVERASERLQARIISAWGMTENGAVTTTRPDDPDEKVFGTDGLALRGMEVRTVDAKGAPAAAGEEGRLQTRGASNFVGYLKRPELYGVDDEGWFDTGDLARMDGDGYIRISGRSKDVIIRGGENIPVVEVEGLLYKHPAVQAVAIVAMPDPRLGERACAFVELRSGASLAFEEMTAFFFEQKMARQYHPERLEIVEELPRTPSGKIQKFKLRETAQTLAAA